MRITNIFTPVKFMQNPQREVLRHKYLNPKTYEVEAVVTVDKNTGEFISYDKFTPENPYIDENGEPQRPKKPVKVLKPKHQIGDEFTTTYLKPDHTTVDMQVKYRWISENEYEVVEVKRFKQNNEI